MSLVCIRLGYCFSYSDAENIKIVKSKIVKEVCL